MRRKFNMTRAYFQQSRMIHSKAVVSMGTSILGEIMGKNSIQINMFTGKSIRPPLNGPKHSILPQIKSQSGNR